MEVNLDGNKIRQLGPPSALSGLGNLRKLRMEDNGLRVLSPGLGAATPALLSLSLAQNRLSDPAELDRLGALPNLMELSVCGNPMARRASLEESVEKVWCCGAVRLGRKSVRRFARGYGTVLCSFSL